MAVAVAPTLPFSATDLALDEPSRWTTLLPLLRPGLQILPATPPSTDTIILDLSTQSGPLSTAPYIIVESAAGHFSWTAFQRRSAAGLAITSSDHRPSTAASTAERIATAAPDVVRRGVVLVRAAATGKGSAAAPASGRASTAAGEVETLVVEVADVALLDHAVSVVDDAKVRSVAEAREVLEGFVRGVWAARGRFHDQTDGSGRPAVRRVGGEVSGFDSARDAVRRDMRQLLAAQEGAGGTGDGVVYSVHCADVNGLSQLERYIVAKELAEYLDERELSYRLSHSTVLDHDDTARGYQISISAMSARFVSAQSKPAPHQTTTTAGAAAKAGLGDAQSSSIMTFSDAAVRERIVAGCEAVIVAEPRITEYDTIVGDGDCGFTLRDGAHQVLAFIAGRDLSQLPATVGALVEALEIRMGGTSGALYCIFLTALASALATEPTLPRALRAALDQLLCYTRAREGDRTMMDALIPFVETWERGGDVRAALLRAREGVDGTKTMQARLGRSAYLDDEATQGVPDPGAYGLLMLLKGMVEDV